MKNTCTIVSMNATSSDLYIDGDPNWDDQQLKIDGRIIRSPYISSSGQSVGCSIDWPEDIGDGYMMGIIFSGNNLENQNSFQMTIGQNSQGLMTITENYPIEPLSIKYSVVAQTEWILVLKFEDA